MLENRNNLSIDKFCMQVNKKLIIIHVIFITALIVGFILGFYINNIFKKKASTRSEIEYREKKNKSLVNPLLECDDNFVTEELSPFANEVKILVDRLTQEKKINKISIIFRDIYNASIFQINPNEKYIPASLLKVPAMISILKKSEEDPSILKQEIKYTEELKNIFVNTESETKEVVGETYTVEQLVENMIIYSDNVALALLSNHFLQVIDFDSIFSDLNVDLNNVNYNSSFFNTSSYARFLMVLYNASYLSEENSKKALSLLTKVKYDKGITGDLPRSVTVAHKYGVRVNKNDVEMHDCGIIYFPNKPYLLCVMTASESRESAEYAISMVSKYVYDKISIQMKTFQSKM